MIQRSGYYGLPAALLTWFVSMFVIEKDDLLPKPMLSFIRFLELTDAEVGHTVEKGRLPKAKLAPAVLSAAIKVLQRRLAQYATTVDVSIPGEPS